MPSNVQAVYKPIG